MRRGMSRNCRTSAWFEWGGEGRTSPQVAACGLQDVGLNERARMSSSTWPDGIEVPARVVWGRVLCHNEGREQNGFLSIPRSPPCRRSRRSWCALCRTGTCPPAATCAAHRPRDAVPPCCCKIAHAYLVAEVGSGDIAAVGGQDRGP